MRCSQFFFRGISVSGFLRVKHSTVTLVKTISLVFITAAGGVNASMVGKCDTVTWTQSISSPGAATGNLPAFSLRPILTRFLYKLCFAASILQIQEYLCTLSKNYYYHFALTCIIFCKFSPELFLQRKFCRNLETSEFSWS